MFKMNEEVPKYLENPEKYGERINALLQKNSDEWQNVWKAAIPELWSLPPNEISVINVLLKPVEAAFKSRDYKLRVQAFDCWSYFIIHYEKLPACDKLWNVLLIPLLACNHSVYIVLQAKLKTWHTLVDTNLVTQSIVMKKAIPNLLKFLYGPHTLDTASSFAALSETCGQIYHKLMLKCVPFDETREVVFSYLDRAIPPLSNLENTQKLAVFVWSDALKIISQKEWPKNYFTFLMRTLENLISDNKNDGYQLVNNFLSILMNIYGSFPPDRLTLHLNLAIRCLFYPPINMTFVNNIMDSLLKRSEKPSFFFYQLDMVLSSSLNIIKGDLDKLWTAVATCYSKWVKNNNVNESTVPMHDYTLASRILLFPLLHMSELTEDTEKLNAVLKQWKICYEACLESSGCSEKFLQFLLQKLKDSIDKVPSDDLSPKQKFAICLCKTILNCCRRSDVTSNLKPVLLKLHQCMPPLKKLSDPSNKSYVVKYIVTILCYVNLVPGHSDQFSSIIKNFSHLIPKEDTDEFAVIQKSKINGVTKSDDCSIDSTKIMNGVSAKGDKTTSLGKTKMRTSFLERLSPANRKTDVSESPARSQSTPKSSKENEDVQFVEISTKPKNSPMTEHQREIAKEKRYIPALYQDLSQSQSQSQSESVSLLSGNKKSSDLQAELFEENANLPPTTESSASIVPASLSFRSGLDELNKPTTFNSKKVLFSEKNEEKLQDAVMPEKHEIGNMEKSTGKRKSSKEVDEQTSMTSKRCRRISTRLQFDGIVPGNAGSSPSRDESIRKRLRSKADQSHEKTDKVECINLTDSESQNVFVSISSSKKTSVSTPLNSLMNVKDLEDGGSSKRKSLRARRTITPNNSPIVTRKRKSANLEENQTKNEKKVKANNVQAASSAEKSNENENLVKKVESNKNEEEQSNSEKNVENITEDIEIAKVPACLEFKNNPTKEIVNDSIILVEQSSCEIISIEDSECDNVEKKNNLFFCKREKVKSNEDISDESTFYEGSVDQSKSKSDEDCANENEKIIQIQDVEFIPVSHSNETATNISPEIVGSEKAEELKISEVNVEKETLKVNVEENSEDVASISILRNPPNFSDSISILEKSPNSRTSDEIIEIESSVSSNEMQDNIEKDFICNSKTNENIDFDLNELEKSKNEEKSTSPIPSNSRASQMMKLAYNSQNIPRSPKQRMYSKPGRPPRAAKGGSIVQFLKNTPNRASQIFKLINDVENECPTYTTPTKSVTTPVADKLKYIPKECTSPGILKKHDANQTSSPRSSKFVNFADQLTATREFYKDEDFETDSLVSTGDDKLSNTNLINNEEVKSQDMLYPPLQNCRDNVEHVLEYIFSSSWCKQALTYLQLMDINTVGQLASMSTITATSIPAGDNRIERLRRGLKKYDEMVYESKGLRKPSSRRKIIKSPQECKSYLEISCIIDLLNEAELVEKDLSSDESNEKSTDDLNSESNLENAEQTIEASNIPIAENHQLNKCKPKESILESSDRVSVPQEIQINAKNDGNVSVEKIIDENVSDITPMEESFLFLSKEPVTSEVEPMETIEEPIDNTKSEKPNKTENKENLDPFQVDKCIPEHNIAEPELVAIDPPEENEKINESGNDSMDYVCTDSDKIYDEDATDKRVITMKNMHRYSIITESEESIDVSSTPANKLKPSAENTSPEIVIVDTDESMSEDKNKCDHRDEVQESDFHSLSIFSPSKPPVLINDNVEDASQSLIEGSKNIAKSNLRSRIENTESGCVPKESENLENNSEISVIVERSTVFEENTAKEITLIENEVPDLVTDVITREESSISDERKWRSFFSNAFGSCLSTILLQNAENEEQVKACFLNLIDQFNESLSSLNMELILRKKY